MMTSTVKFLGLAFLALTQRCYADASEQPIPSNAETIAKHRTVKTQGFHGGRCSTLGATQCSLSNHFFYRTCVNGRWKYKRFGRCESCELNDSSQPFVDPYCTYSVTFTNLAYRQPFSPLLVVTHTDEVALYEMGQEASAELAILAEDGNTSPLTAMLNTSDAVDTVMTVPGQGASAPIIPPGGSVTFKLQVKAGQLVSLATMAINTNDCFVALNGLYLNARDATHDMPGLDAGSEENNEDCDFMPGPACPQGSSNNRATENAEGFVHVHRGIHGGADLMPSVYDWRNPMARATFEREI